jgi:hypothetical protein
VVEKRANLSHYEVKNVCIRDAMTQISAQDKRVCKHGTGLSGFQNHDLVEKLLVPTQVFNKQPLCLIS